MKFRDWAVVRWLASRRVGSFFVFFYLVAFSFFVGSWALFCLFFPVYWRLWFMLDAEG